MERLQAAWLHQKFCKGRTLTHVTEPGGIIAEMFCTHCQISLWKIGDDAGLPIIGGHSEEYLKLQEKHGAGYADTDDRPEDIAASFRGEYDSRRYAMPNRSYMTTSGEYDPLLGRCDLCDELSIYASMTCRLCHEHLQNAVDQRKRRQALGSKPQCCYSGCKRNVAYGTPDTFVTVCKRHYELMSIIAGARNSS